jgi:hypothetical protein
MGKLRPGDGRREEGGHGRRKEREEERERGKTEDNK